MSDGALARSRPISGLASLWRSSIGKQFVMAATGLIWFGYLLLQKIGGLLAAQGLLEAQRRKGTPRATGLQTDLLVTRRARRADERARAACRACGGVRIVLRRQVAPAGSAV
jgi:hypothetical protein